MSVEFWKAIFDWGAVVLVGLTFIAGAGALITGRIINDRQSAQLQKMGADLTAAQTELAEQQERAAVAEADIARAQAEAANANKGAAEANAKAEGFRLDIARANEQAAEANETAERERLARLQLEARLADRVLAPVSQSRLTAMAAAFPRGTRIDIYTFGGTLEVAAIAGSIANSLQEGGWTVIQWQVTAGASVRGILVGTSPSADPTEVRAAAEFVSVLNYAGIAAGPWKFDDLKPGGIVAGPAVKGLVAAPIRVFIGAKQ